MRHTLRKQDILRGYGDFQKVFKKGEIFAEKYLKIIVLREEQASKQEMLKIGFAVEKRFCSAVDRNRLKRKMREIVRINKNRLVEQCKEGKITNLILLCRPSRNKKSGQIYPNIQEIEKEFFHLLTKLV